MTAKQYRTRADLMDRATEASSNDAVIGECRRMAKEWRRLAMAAQKQGLISYTRGSVKILDRSGLEKGACECRASVQHLRHLLEPDSVLGKA